MIYRVCTNCGEIFTIDDKEKSNIAKAPFSDGDAEHHLMTETEGTDMFFIWCGPVEPVHPKLTVI